MDENTPKQGLVADFFVVVPLDHSHNSLGVILLGSLAVYNHAYSQINRMFLQEDVCLEENAYRRLGKMEDLQQQGSLAV